VASLTNVLQHHAVSRQAPTGASVEAVARMLRRYPHVTDEEEASMVKFMKSARYVEIVPLISDRALARQFDLFVKHHRRELDSGIRYGIATIALAFSLVAIFALISNQVA